MDKTILYFGVFLLIAISLAGCSKEVSSIVGDMDCSKALADGASMTTRVIKGEWQCCGNGVMCSDDEKTIIECHNNIVKITHCPEGKVCYEHPFDATGSCITDESDEAHRCDDYADGGSSFTAINNEWKCCGNATRCSDNKLITCTNNVVSITECPEGQVCVMNYGEAECVASGSTGIRK